MLPKLRAHVLRAGTLGAGPKIDPLSLTAGLPGPGQHGTPGGGLRPWESPESLLQESRKARAVLDLGAVAGGGWNTESEAPREEASSAVGLGSLGRAGEKAGEVQKRGAGKPSGVEGAGRGHGERGEAQGVGRKARRGKRPEPESGECEGWREMEKRE